MSRDVRRTRRLIKQALVAYPAGDVQRSSKKIGFPRIPTAISEIPFRWFLVKGAERIMMRRQDGVSNERRCFERTPLERWAHDSEWREVNAIAKTESLMHKYENKKMLNRYG